MAPLSLGALCRKTVAANIDELSYVSDLPYSKVKDLLARVRHDDQLRDIEEASPQIQNGTDELWEVWTNKKFSVQLKKMKKLNNDRPLEIASWRDLYWQLREEDDEREAQALAHLQKTFTTLNKNKDLKANLADPRRLRGRARRITSSRLDSTIPGHYFASSSRDTLVQKARKEADKMVNNRQLAIRAMMTPKKALSIVPKGLSEAMRIRRQPTIPMRSDKRAAMGDSGISERECEERREREARLLAAQKPKSLTNDGIHMPGTTIPNGLPKLLEDARKPAATTNFPTPPKAASSPAKKPSTQFTSSLFSCPPDLKPHSRVKTVTSTAPVVSAYNPLTGRKMTLASPHNLSGSASSPPAESTTETDSDDDLFGEKRKPKKPVTATPSSPNKRPISMVAGSSDSSNPAVPMHIGGQPLRKKRKETGIFMPTKRAR